MHKIYGKRRAIITATVAKENKMKAQVRLTPDWNDVAADNLPWAEYLLPVDRAFVPTVTGDLVWIEFPYDGDTRRPMIVGAAQDWAGGTPNVPAEASGVGSAYEPPAKDGAPAAATATPTADMVMKRDGIMIVRTASGAYSMTRLADGTSIGFNDAGQISLISEADTYLNAKGPITIITDGDAKVIAKGKLSFKGATMDFEAGKFSFKQG